MAEARVCIQSPKASLRMTVRNDGQRRFVHRFLREFAGGPRSVPITEVEGGRTDRERALDWLFDSSKEDNTEA